MCGRYSNVPKKPQLEKLLEEFQLPDQLELGWDNYNIAPTQQAWVITALDAPPQKMEFGLIPHWSRDGANTGSLINARTETVAEKPSFRESIQARRCLVLADSFYEWKKLPGGRKVPYRILLKDGNLLFMAGIWDEWRGAEGVKRSFSILTTPPNLEMSALHNRMPLFFPAHEQRQRWLSPIEATDVLAMLKPPDDGLLRYYRVSEALNAPKNNGEGLHREVGEELTLF